MRTTSLFLFASLGLASVAPAAPNATLITPVPIPAISRVATVQVRVAPDHRDWTYRPGETVTFRVTVTADNEPIEGATVRYEVGPEFMPPRTTQTATVPAAGLVIDGGTLAVPGFLRCIATTEVAGRSYRGLATAGFAPEQITPTQTEPADFDAFWRAGREELARVPMEPRVTLLPEACTSTVNVYHVSFRGVGEAWTASARVYGILCEPKAPGHYPGVLLVPGAGVRPYFGDKGTAARGAITLEIGIHGIPVNLQQEVYDQLLAGALKEYWLYNLDDRDRYYYRRVILGSLRANDFLTSREAWDGKNLIVIGASQGGMLAIATAALDGRVTGLSATHPALCDLTGDLHGRAGGWPHPFQRDGATGQAANATPAKIATTGYYDTVNFARRVHVPGHYLWGYNDEVCPPTTMFAAFNTITAPKELSLLLEVGHAYPVEQNEHTAAWIARFLNLK